jgi:hypothetical protein
LGAGYYCYNTKLYSCQCLQDDVIIRDFIPVRRDVDQAVGLYDFITHYFYTPIGNALVAGPPLMHPHIDNEYEFLEYLESTTGGG